MDPVQNHCLLLKSPYLVVVILLMPLNSLKKKVLSDIIGPILKMERQMLKVGGQRIAKAEIELLTC